MPSNYLTVSICHVLKQATRRCIRSRTIDFVLNRRGVTLHRDHIIVRTELRISHAGGVRLFL